MKEQIIAILSELRPEFDFCDDTLDFVEEGMLDLKWTLIGLPQRISILLMPLSPLLKETRNKNDYPV